MDAIQAWQMKAVGEPLVQETLPAQPLGPGEVRVEVAGCGVCHTDLGYLFDGVRTRHPLPLVLGHEISGVVCETGSDSGEWLNRKVVVPAVIPCENCPLCRRGRGSICPKQVFVGCDVHGGFASHVVVPARGLCAVDDAELASSAVELADLAVLADAISTPYQAILRAHVQEGDVAVIVGAGGVGGFGAQIAAALGAHVIALDVDAKRLERLTDYGVSHWVDVSKTDAREVRKQLRGLAKERGWPDTCWKIFETSGNAAGQRLAFSLLNHGATLSVVGYTLDSVDIRLSNLMAFDAVAQGNWGCLPEHYPAALDLILAGDIAVTPFVDKRPMSQINQTLDTLHHGGLPRRPILIPDFSKKGAS